MTRRERIAAAVYDAVEDLNGQLPRSQRLVKDPATLLLGPPAALDSLGIVNLIAASQQRIEEEFGLRLSLADAAFLAAAPQILASLGSFISYLDEAVERAGR